MSIFFCRKKYVIVFATMITNMCHLFFMFINDKYMSRVFMYKWKIYLWVSDRRRLSAAATSLSEFWCVLILLWSLVLFNVVVVFLESPERRHSIMVTWALVVTRLWVSLDLIFSMFFCFIFVYWRLFSFCSVEMKMGWWLCFRFVIFSENHGYGFLGWRYGFFSYGVVLLDAYLDSTWLVLS